MPNDENNEKKLTPLEEKWINTALEEYKVLRAEILAQFQNRNQLLTFGTAVLALFVNAGVTALKDDNTHLGEAAYFISALFIPLICFFIVIFWTSDSATIAKIGSFLSLREQRISGYFSTMNAADTDTDTDTDADTDTDTDTDTDADADADTDTDTDADADADADTDTDTDTDADPLVWERRLRSKFYRSLDIVIQAVVVIILFSVISVFSSLYSKNTLGCPKGVPCDVVFNTSIGLVSAEIVYGLWKTWCIWNDMHNIAKVDQKRRCTI